MTAIKKPIKNRIPDFQNKKEEAAWFDTHDVSEFWDELTPVNGVCLSNCDFKRPDQGLLAR